MALSLSDVIKTKKLKKEDKQNENGENFLRKKFAPFQVDPSLENIERVNIQSNKLNEEYPNSIKGSEIELGKDSVLSNIVKNESETFKKENELRNNPVTIQEQFRNNSTLNDTKELNNLGILHNDPVTVTEQSRNNSVTVKEQQRKNVNNRREMETKRTQSRNNSVTQTVTSYVNVTEQFRNILKEVTFNFLRVSGHKKRILEVIFNLCQKNGSLLSGPISKENIENLTGIDGEVIRITCYRLIKEGALSRTSFKSGSGGFVEYELNQAVYSQILNTQLKSHPVTIQEQFRNNSVTQTVTQTVTELSRQTDRGFVSQFENEENSFPKKETKEKLSTLSNSAKSQTTWNFANLDFSAVHPINLTIVNVAIQRDAEMTLTQEVVQDFINRFATYLSFQNTKKIQNSCGLFCSELKKLINPAENGRTQVFDFETEAERKINAEMAQKIIKIQMENELVEKARELSSDKEKFESEKEVWMQKVRSSSQGINLSEEIIYITAFGNWKEAQQK